MRDVFIMIVTQLRLEIGMFPTANNNHFVGQSANKYKCQELHEVYTSSATTKQDITGVTVFTAIAISIILFTLHLPVATCLVPTKTQCDLSKTRHL
jgi:hypothetical protein